MGFPVTITGATVRRVLLGLRLLVGAALGGLVYGAVVLLRLEDPFGPAWSVNRWQAVFLSNGQVYFGHLRVASEEFYELRDAFFIQKVPGEEGQPPKRKVRPLSSEFHGPEDRMLIRRDDALRVEKLRPGSDVAEAIERVHAPG